MLTAFSIPAWDFLWGSRGCFSLDSSYPQPIHLWPPPQIHSHHCSQRVPYKKLSPQILKPPLCSYCSWDKDPKAYRASKVCPLSLPPDSSLFCCSGHIDLFFFFFKPQNATFSPSPGPLHMECMAFLWKCSPNIPTCTFRLISIHTSLHCQCLPESATIEPSV